MGFEWLTTKRIKKHYGLLRHPPKLMPKRTKNWRKGKMHYLQLSTAEHAELCIGFGNDLTTRWALRWVGWCC